MIDEQNAGGQTVSNTEFLGVLAASAPDGTALWVTNFIGNPSAASPWGGQVYGPQQHHDRIADSWGRYNSYFSVSALRPGPDGTIRRRKANFARLLALVADDAHADGLMGSASWILETSPGKIQIGVLLDEADPDCADERLVTGLINIMTRRGLIGGDLSGNNIVRYVRLPVGQNQKQRASGPWQHRLATWAPGHRLTLDDAAATFGIDLEDVRIELANPVTSASAIDVGGEQEDRLRDSVANILAGKGLHESINRMAASLVSSGAHGGSVVNTLRALMEASAAPRDGRWQDRYNDIPRAVSTAEEKFKRPEIARPAVVIDLDGAITEAPAEDDLFIQAGEGMNQAGAVKWVINGYIEDRAVSVVYGPSGVGKSFLMIDQACCVATGMPWQGREVKQGAVFYLAGEGHFGVFRRIRAWAKTNGRDMLADPLFVSRRAVSLTSRESVAAMTSEIDKMSSKSGAHPRLVIIDTLARSMVGADENASKDMGQFIAEIDSIKERYSCHVMVVHHTGHDATRARGSSALRGAMDQEFSISGGGGRFEYENTKMKDAESPETMVFSIKKVVIGVDEDDVEISSAVTVREGDSLEMEFGKTSSGEKVTVLDMVKAMPRGWPGRERLALELRMGVKAVRLAIDRALKVGVLEKDGPGYAVSERILDEASRKGAMLE